MVEASKEWNITGPCIEKSSNNATEKAIKSIILQMLQFEPSHRITAAEVVDRLTELKGNGTELEQPTAAQEELKGNTTTTPAQEELKGNTTTTPAQEELKGSTTTTASQEELKGNTTTTAAQEELKGNTTTTATHEEHKGNKTKGQQSRSRMPKWWPGSKK